MCEINAGVDIAYKYAWAAAGDRMRLRRMDLPHIPLERGEGIRVRCRGVAHWTCCWSTGIAGGTYVILNPGRERGGRGRSVDPSVFEQIRAKGRAVGSHDGDANLRVLVDKRSARLRQAGRCICGNRRSAVQHDVVLHRAGTGRYGRG